MKDHVQSAKEHINEINREMSNKLSAAPTKRGPPTMSGAPSSDAFINTMDQSEIK